MNAWSKFIQALRVFALASLALAVVGLCVNVQAASPARRKIIIDQDAYGPGGSNMQSMLMLMQSPDVEVLGIAVVSGDGWRDENIAHTLRLLEIAKRTDIPVYAGTTYPLINSAARTKKWEELYGKLVYKGAWTESWPKGEAVPRQPYHDPFMVPPLPEGAPKIKAAQGSAVSFMISKIHEFPGEVTIWAAGPMTDIALAARLDPEFAGLAKELVFMGGSFNPKPADNPFAAEYTHATRLEFNMRWDPEAASLVLHEPWKKIVQVPVDPTTQTFFKKEFFTEITKGQAPFDAYLGKYAQSFPMWDELAAAVWLDPTLVTRSERIQVDIDTAFNAGYGNTLSWPLGKGPDATAKPVDVVMDIDLHRFERMTIDLLSKPSPTR